MKRLFTLLFAMTWILQSFAQTNIYNPDADNDGFITSGDLLMFLSLFETNFTPNPCNCGCYANPFYQPFEVQDTLTAYQVASNLFNAQPDSIRLDFVISPFGVGSIPFSDVDTLYYDTLAFSQTYPWRLTQLGSNNSTWDTFGDYVAYMYFRDEPSSPDGVASTGIDGGLDVIDTQHPNFNSSFPSSLRVEAEDLCPNIGNEEYWFVHEDSTFIQVSEGQYVNLFQGASPQVPTNGSEYPTWSFRYPLDWLVITAIYNDPTSAD